VSPSSQHCCNLNDWTAINRPQRATPNPNNSWFRPWLSSSWPHEELPYTGTGKRSQACTAMSRDEHPQNTPNVALWVDRLSYLSCLRETKQSESPDTKITSDDGDDPIPLVSQGLIIFYGFYDALIRGSTCICRHHLRLQKPPNSGGGASFDALFWSFWYEVTLRRQREWHCKWGGSLLSLTGGIFIWR